MKKILLCLMVVCFSLNANLFADDLGDGMVSKKDFYKILCEKGNNAEGCYNLGFMYFDGIDVKQNYSKANELFKKACDGGYAEGCGNLGYSYFHGKGVRQDYFKASKLYKEACDGGVAIRCGQLGLMYEEGGQGVKQNKHKAKQFYGKGCDLQNQTSCKLYKILNKQGY